MRDLKIKGRRIGKGHPVYIVAEMSANHNGDYRQAVSLLHAAKEAGADAIKLQVYTPDTMTIPCSKEFFRIGPGTPWSGRLLYDLYREASTPWDWLPPLAEVARELDLDFFATAFDHTAVEFLERLGVAVHKIASFEITDLLLIEAVARTGKPLIISTGMATLEEIAEAVKTAYSNGAQEIALLKCTSAYPAPPQEMHLRTIPHLLETFGVPVGLSDHTLGIAVPVAAVALGACLIEKHFTLSRAIPGPDSTFSLEPQEFKAMVEAVRTVEKALGEVHYGCGPEEGKSRQFRRSLFVVQDLRAGEIFSETNVRAIRPGFGLPPRYFREVLGRRASRDISAGTPLSWELVEGSKGNEEEYSPFGWSNK